MFYILNIHIHIYKMEGVESRPCYPSFPRPCLQAPPAHSLRRMLRVMSVCVCMCVSARARERERERQRECVHVCVCVCV